MKNLKVLLVSEYFPPKIFGGGEISALQLAKALAKKGMKVYVLTSYFPNLKKCEEKDGFKIFRTLKTGSNPASIFQNLKRSICFQRSLKRELRKIGGKIKFDYIHFLNTTSIPNFKIKNKNTFATINGYTNFCPKRNMFYKEKSVCTGCSAEKFIGCISNSKFIGKIKMSFFMKYNPVFWFVIYRKYKKSNQSLKNVNNYFAISKFIEDLLVRNGVKKKNIARLPNIVNIKSSDKKFEIMKKGPVVTYIGPSLGKFKGVEMLIQAFKGAQKNSKLLIFGDGPEKEHLKRIAGDNVIFYKSVPYEYLGSIYEQSDIIVHPALWPEPLSRVTIETLHFGKPLIATAVGGNNDCVIDGKNGYLVKSKTEMTKRLRELIAKPFLRSKMGYESKKLFNEKFNGKKVIGEIMKNYGK